jgi:hypothetical protein
MTKSETSSPLLLKRIDELTINDHPFLCEEDEIYYLGEYTNRKGAEHSPMNQRILNYKKEKKWEGKPGWTYKESAIREVADLFRLSLLQSSGFAKRIKNALLIPIPPHKIKTDPEYDDRNLKMLKYLMPKGPNRDVETLQSNFCLLSPQSTDFNEFWLFDDILRNRTHFRAISNLIQSAFPKIKVVRFFIARSVNQSLVFAQ